MLRQGSFKVPGPARGCYDRAMIALLRGRLVERESDALVLDVGGVGYRVHVPSGLLAAPEGPGEEMTLHTHLHVRESELTLYGCADRPSIQLFEALIGVNGVGPRLAMAMLSTHAARDLQVAIVMEDVPALVAVPGVGKKTAQRVILDLGPKLESSLGDAAPASPGAAGGAAFPSGAEMDAMAALTALGYSSAEARRALAAADLPEDADVEDRIRAALQAMAGG